MSEDNTAASERRLAFIGFALALALTLSSFAIVVAGIGSTLTIVTIIAVLAIVQVLVHLRYFLHLDLSKSKREDLQLVLFAALLILLMVGGSLWILWSMQLRMMAM